MVDDENGNEVPAKNIRTVVRGGKISVEEVDGPPLESEDEHDARVAREQEEAGRRAAASAEAIAEALLESPDGRLSREQVIACATEAGYEPGEQIELMVRRAKERGIIRKTEEELKREMSAGELQRRDVSVGIRRGVAAALHRPKPSGITPFKHCFVRPIDVERATTAGILMVEKAPERPSLGLVIAVGAGFNKELQNAGNNRVIKPGDVLIFSRYGGQEIMLPEGKFHILAPGEVFAIYEPAAGIVS